MRPRTMVAVLAAGLALAACTGGGPAPADLRAAVDGAAEGESTVPPGPDAVLAAVTWPQAAAWILRAADDGMPVVVNLFGSWCEPCRDEAPLLRAAITANPDVTFLLVDVRDGRLLGQRFLEEFGLIDVPSLFDDQNVVYEGLGARGMPSTFFFASSGVLVASTTGPLTDQTLTEGIDAIREPTAAP